MSTARFDGIIIPCVYAISITRELVGERARTAAGKLRQDVVAIKRVWELQTRPISKDLADTLLSWLDEKLYFVGDFWLDEFGPESETVKAYVLPDSVEEERVQFGNADGWHRDGRQISMTIVEQ